MAERHTIETYGHTIAGRRRHAWPILLSFWLYSNHYLHRPYNTSKVNDSFGSSAIFSEMIRTIIELFKIIIISCYTIEIAFLIEIKSSLERLLSTMN